MARQLTKTLTKLSLSITNPRFPIRSFSSKPQSAEIELDSSPAEIELVANLKRLEDVIHNIIVRRLEPDWLAFRPGSSYWVPPSRSIADSLVKFAGKLSNPLTDDESMSVISSGGWPSSSFFLDQEMLLDNSNCSRWIPPFYTDAGDTDADYLIHRVGTSTNPLTEEESLSLTSANGWPSSSYFFEQASPYPIEVHAYPQELEDSPSSDEE